jgi:hypothetical protein
VIDDDDILARYRAHATERPRLLVDQAILEAASRHGARPVLRFFGVGLAASLVALAATVWWFGPGHNPVVVAPVESAGIAEGRSDGLAGQAAMDAPGMNEGRTVDVLARAL